MDNQYPALKNNMSLLMDQTFRIYKENFWKFSVLIVAVVVPIEMLKFSLSRLPDTNPLNILTSLLIQGVGFLVIFSIGGAAVWDIQIKGKMEIRQFMGRVLQASLSLVLATVFLLFAVAAIMLFCAITFILINTVVTTISIVERSMAVLFVILAAPLLFSIITFWCMTLDIVLIEKLNALKALRRNLSLIRGHYWHFGYSSIGFGLAAFGLGILFTVPFAATNLINPTSVGLISQLSLQWVNGSIVGITVPPVLFISSALLYRDLMIRDESTNQASPSWKIGIGSA